MLRATLFIFVMLAISVNCAKKSGGVATEEEEEDTSSSTSSSGQPDSGDDNDSTSDDSTSDEEEILPGEVPTADPQSANVYTSQPLGLTLTGADAESPSITFSIVDQPASGTLDTSSMPLVTYTPDPGFTGADFFTFTASDGFQDSVIATINLTVLDWCHEDFSFRVRLDFDNRNSTIDSVSSGVASQQLDDFVAVVKLDEPNFEFDDIEPDGADIRFFDGATGLFLNYEIESWDDIGEVGIAFVKLNKIDANSNSDSVYVYYGNVGAVTTEDPGNVWNGYSAVYHMSESPEDPAPQFQDSTGNGNAMTAEASMVAGARVSAQIGNGIQLDGTNNYILKDDFVDFPTAQITASMWVNTASTGEGLISYATGGAPDDNQFMLQSQDNLEIWRRLETLTTGVNISTGAWRLLTATWNKTQDGGSNNYYIYDDGAVATSGALSNGIEILPNGALAIGNDQDSKGGGFAATQALLGTVDEVRVFPGIQTPAWIAAEYLSQSDQFISYNAAEPKP